MFFTYAELRNRIVGISPHNCSLDLCRRDKNHRRDRRWNLMGAGQLRLLVSGIGYAGKLPLRAMA
jgi:hypothetical protein